jgi:polyphosphate kinase
MNELVEIQEVGELSLEFPKDKHIKKIISLLETNKLNQGKVKKVLDEIIKLADHQIINFELLYKGLKRNLPKKGNKRKAIEDYFLRVHNSLKFRERGEYGVEPEAKDFEFEIEEPSLIPKKIYKKELYYLQVELLKLEEWLKKTKKTVTVVFEGRDSAGKGSTIKKFTEHMDPKGFKVTALGVPTPEERENWWERYKKEIKPGKINFFDRSWYNRGLIEPVMGYGTDKEYEDFLENVEKFEDSLVTGGNYLIKLWFSIEKDTQAKRFEMRQQSPLKYWKYSPNDAKMQDLWDRFTEFKDRLFDKTSTFNHPWVVIDSNDKKISGLNAIRYVLKQIPYENKNIDLLQKEYPEVLTVLRPNIG